MPKFIHYTEQQKEQARMTKIADILRNQGEAVRKSGTEEEWLNGNQKVSIKGNLWYHQYEQIGGNAIDFVQKFMNKSYPEAMDYLLGNSSLGALSVSMPIEHKPPGPLELPKRNDTMRRVYSYLLSTRGIDKDILSAFVKKNMIYESAEYHNVVFVGYDKNGIAKHASYRGTSKSQFRGNATNSSPEFSFHWHGQSNNLYLFEAPIDMLSFISMHKTNWQEHSYASCCGVGDRVVYQMLEDNPNISNVILCLDNDEGGRKATQAIKEKLAEKRIQHEVLVPINKDWNEDLLYSGGDDNQEESQCLELHY